MATRRKNGLEPLQAVFKALVDIGEEVREKSQYPDQEPHDPAEAASFRELGSQCTRQAALKQLMRDFLVRWNEGVGADVEAFWRLVDERGLPIERKHDVVAATLARGRILNPPEFLALEERFEELQTCGKVTPEEAEALNQMLNAFEDDPKNFKWTSAR